MYFRNREDRLMSVPHIKPIPVVLVTGLGLLLCSLALAQVGAAVPQSSSAGQYHLAKKVVLGGDGGWDYFTVDPAAHRIFIARGTHTMLVDPNGRLAADIPNMQGARAVEFAPDLNRAFTSNGSASSVTIFDLATLKIIHEVKIPGRDTDAILYDPVTKRVFTFNGRDGKDATAIDARAGTVLGNIPLGSKLETAQTDGKGHIFVNIENKNLLRELDSKTLKVINTWPLAPCDSPSGQAIDTAHQRLIIGPHNHMMALVDYNNGKVVATVPIGQSVAANRFDPGTGLAFASCGDGTITVAHEDSPDKFTVVQTMSTQRGVRTMALDTSNHNIYAVTSEFGPAPAPTADDPRPRPSPVPNTFTLLIFRR
jgi:DNA-binding beta-propeller fold protein YncE